MRFLLWTIILSTAVVVTSNKDVLSLINSFSEFTRDDLVVLTEIDPIWYENRIEVGRILFDNNDHALYKKHSQLHSLYKQFTHGENNFINKLFMLGGEEAHGTIRNDVAWTRLQNEMQRLSTDDCIDVQSLLPQLSELGPCKRSPPVKAAAVAIATTTTRPTRKHFITHPSNCNYGHISYDLQAIGHLQEVMEIYMELGIIRLQANVQDLLMTHISYQSISDKHERAKKCLGKIRALLRASKGILATNSDGSDIDNDKLREALIHISRAAQAYLKIAILTNESISAEYANKLVVLENLKVDSPEMMASVMESIVKI